MRIGTCKMAFDDAVRPVVLEDGRQVAGIETGRAGGYERGKRPATHQRVHLRHILDTKSIGLEHDDHHKLAGPKGKGAV